jgi:hypothetical protein
MNDMAFNKRDECIFAYWFPFFFVSILIMMGILVNRVWTDDFSAIGFLSVPVIWGVEIYAGFVYLDLRIKSADIKKS